MRFKSARGRSLILLIFFFTIISPNIVYATSCLPPANVIREYPIVFKGKVIATTELPTKYTTTTSPSGEVVNEENQKAFFGSKAVTKFEVQEVYKGHVGKEVDVHHLINGWTSVSYKDGMTYVIFTSKDINKEGGIETGLCSPRLVLEEKEEGSYYNDWPDFKAQLDAYVEIKKSFESLLKENPDNPHLYFQQAEFYESNNDYPAAELVWRKGITARAARCQICTSDRKPGTDTDFESYEGQVYVSRYIESLEKQGKIEEVQRILDMKERRRLEQNENWKKKTLEKKSTME